MTHTYTLLVYWDHTRVGYGTVLGDHTIDLLIAQANEWVGAGRWNRLELAPAGWRPPQEHSEEPL